MPAKQIMFQAADILDRVAHFADELKLIHLDPQIAACRHQLHAGNGIDVAVFGRFKAGKSSFLNHLTGRDILPIGVVPLTAVITRLRYGSNEKVEVRFLNGSAKTIPLDEIGRYVGENKNPNNEKQVASVEVELPALKPFAPLQFVDTPGLGSAFVHNTEAALNWLPNVGMALVAVSSDAPLSERDLALLDELRRHTPKIVLLLTKTDLLDETQRTEVLAFVREQCRRKWNMELPVFFYSIQPALAKFKTELSEQLLTPLLRNRSEAAGQILRHKLESLTLQTLDYVRVALAAATQAESARAALREKLGEERRQFDLLRSELNALSHQWSANALNWSLARLQPTQAALQWKITDDLRGQFPRWRLRLPALLKVWREWLDVFLERELSVVSREQQTMFREPLHRARLHLTRTLRAFHDRLAEHVKTALGVSLAPREFILEAPEPSAPPVDVGFVDAAFSLVSFAIPMTWFRRPIERALLRKSRWEVEKNLSRLASDWRDRVAAGIRDLTRQAEQEALDELATFEQMLMQTQSNAPRLRQIIADLENGTPVATIQNVNELPNQVTLLLNSGGSHEAVLEQALRVVLEHFHSETGTIHWLDAEKQLLHLAAQTGLPPQMLGVVKTIPVGKGIAGQVIAQGRAVTICNLQADTSGVARPGAKQTGVGGALCVPLRNGDKIVGTIGIGTTRSYEYTPEETRLLEKIGSVIGSSLA
jgi:GTP-binding protein EngB required for normal cell division/putative methionine-R-sulfoxide reductase with GAF domain